jgi:hypothetical protein
MIILARCGINMVLISPQLMVLVKYQDNTNALLVIVIAARNNFIRDPVRMLKNIATGIYFDDTFWPTVYRLHLGQLTTLPT